MEQQQSELHGLTEKLTAYIKRMRDLRSGRTHVDSLAFFKSVEAMEKEMSNLKNMYEREMDRVRQKVDDVNRQKNHYQHQAEKYEALASELQERLSEEVTKAMTMSDNAKALQLALHEKEMVVQGLSAQAAHETPAENDVRDKNRRMDEVMRENMDLKRRYDAEQLLRQEQEDKRHQLLQKMKFEQQVYEQQCRDLQERITTSTNTILDLESRLRAVELPTDLASILEQVRDASDKELQRYKAESEAAFNRTIGMLKTQMEADNVSFHALTSENRRLLNSIEELNATNHRLQSEVNQMQHLKLSAEENLRLERANAEKHILSLENKLKDFQVMLFEKLKEFNTSKEAAPSLHSEIDTIRTLLQDEQAKAMLLPPISTHRPTLSPPFVAQGEYRSGHAGTDFREISSLRPVSPRSILVPTSGRLSPRRPLSAGPVGPISVSRPTSAHGAEMTSSDVNIEKFPTGEWNESAREQPPSQVESLRPAAGDSKPPEAVAYDYNVRTNSATGDVKIYEVHPDGKYVRLRNGGRKDVELDGFVIQQNVGGQTVAIYRFPSRTVLKTGSFVTVHSGLNDPILHQPPTDFVWTEQLKWGTGPECTTILCKPNGQAIAWTTAAHRFGNLEYSQAVPHTSAESQNARAAPENGCSLPLYQRDSSKVKDEASYLRRERSCPPALQAQKHPHGAAPHSHAHPGTHEARPLIFGNDNSSNNPQTRCQSRIPDPIPGQPYAGASGQRMGSAALLRHVAARQGSVRKNGSLTKQVDGTIRYGLHTPFSSCSFATELRSS